MVRSIFIIAVLCFPAIGEDLGFRYFTPNRKTEEPDCYKRISPPGEEPPSYRAGRNPGYLGECGDLTGQDLSGKTLKGNFNGARFTGANLSDAVFELEGSSFVGSGFKQANLQRVRMRGRCSFRDSDWTESDLRGADVSSLTYTGTVTQGDLPYAELFRVLIDDRTKIFADQSPEHLGLSRYLLNTADQRALGPTVDGVTVTPAMGTALEKLGYHPLQGRFVPGESIHGFHPRTISVKMETAAGWFKTRHYTVVVQLFNENGRVIERTESSRTIAAEDRLSSKEEEALCISALDRLAPAAKSRK